jgi:hypothetical protein
MLRFVLNKAIPEFHDRGHGGAALLDADSNLSSSRVNSGSGRFAAWHHHHESGVCDGESYPGAFG